MTNVDKDSVSGDEVAQIVHDLRSPLATIALESELLDASIGLLGHAAMCAAIHRILRNVHFLDRMIEDLLDLSALDAGVFVLHSVSTDLRALIDGVITRVVTSRDRERVQFEATDDLIADIDELRLQRVIANLLQNALKYAPKHSRILVRLSRASAHAYIAVQDAGPGVAESERVAIFDRYHRARGTLGHDGIGLGLYISKRIVEAHGGRIGVEHISGAGSRFFLELPLH